MAARVALLAAVMREPSISWVTPVDQLYAAENKIVQYRAAVSAGLPVPRTLVALDRHEILSELGEPFVLKPLGPGHFESDNRQQLVFATERHGSDLADVDLAEAPFLAQASIRAERHLRITTVQDEAWVGELDATDLPLDWRSHAPAHLAFKQANWSDVSAHAIHLAKSLGVGMSCQDWIISAEGPMFLDLNPGGQWLFLPESISTRVTNALAAWLTEH